MDKLLLALKMHMWMQYNNDYIEVLQLHGKDGYDDDFFHVDYNSVGWIGARSWTQEEFSSDPDRRVARGLLSVLHFDDVASLANSNVNGWRPVLELVD